MPCSRVAAGISSGPFQLTNRPAATVANTPDPPKCSGTQNVDIGRHQRQRDLNAWVPRPAAQAQTEPSDADPIADLAHHDEGERPRGLTEGEQTGADRRNRKAIQDQSRRIIGETLSFEHDDDAGAGAPSGVRWRGAQPRRAARQWPRARSRRREACRAANGRRPPPHRW